MENLFINATREGWRWPSAVGQLTLEQLWSLPRSSQKGASLDDVYKRLRQQLRAFEEESLLSTSSNKAKTEVEGLEAIVKFIFETKQSEAALEAQETVRAQKKAKLLDVLARKQDAALEEMSEDEIRAALADL